MIGALGRVRRGFLPAHIRRRVMDLGFEVRVELTLGEAERAWVQTKAEAEELRANRGRDRLAAP